MKIEVINSAKRINKEFLVDKTVLVIDVLRASSVICTALFHGAKEIIPVTTVAKAFSATRRSYRKYKVVEEDLPDELNPYHNEWAMLLDTSKKNEQIKKTIKKKSDFLLGGERKGFKIQDFELGNSPLEYTKELVVNKSIVLTTTNGTNAIEKCTTAGEVLIAGFCNIDALCNYIKNHRHVCIVCAGSQGEYSLDDVLCSGNIISILCAQNPDIEISEEAFANKSLYEHMPNKNIHAFLKKGCKHYSYLEKNGFKNDLDYCLQKNTCPVVPIVIDKTIHLAKSN